MTLKVRQQLLTPDDLGQLLEAIASKILWSNPGSPIILLGIERRGGTLARRLSKIIRKRGTAAEVGTLDINLYRDDLTMVAEQPIVRKTTLPVDITGRDVILIDDVLYTGRTIRAALEALNDYGRARSIRLAVLLDRGLRELPIQPDFLGRQIDIGPDQIVDVHVDEIDGDDGSWILEKE
jgi:pyrimidine operon attenuation protein/uracil phosphoribosyltransferase